MNEETEKFLQEKEQQFLDICELNIAMLNERLNKDIKGSIWFSYAGMIFSLGTAIVSLVNIIRGENSIYWFNFVVCILSAGLFFRSVLILKRIKTKINTIDKAC